MFLRVCESEFDTVGNALDMGVGGPVFDSHQ